MSACLLDSLDSDFITEVDHTLKYCYCSKCTCGKHICPQNSPKSYPKSTFTSYYQLNCKKHPVTRRPATSTTPYKKSLFKLESETTKAHDYKDWTPEATLHIQSPGSSFSKHNYKLSSNTTYKQEYSNKVVLKTELIKKKRSSSKSWN